ncbi:MAG: ABC transporter substrate-binding protein [Pseudomonadota bacterium]
MVDRKTLIDRRSFCSSLLSAGLVAPSLVRAEEFATVTDMAGQEVKIPVRPKRIVLLEARDILTMALLHPDPASLVVGWASVDRIDSELLTQSFLQGHSIATVGKRTPDTVSVEGVAGLSPDLVVANTYMVPAGHDDLLIQRLKKLGIPVIFSDFSSNSLDDEAMTGSVLSRFRDHMKMWGRVLDADAAAVTFVEFFESRLKRVASALSGAQPVVTYLEIQSTLEDCCWAAGTRNLGELLELAGGEPLPGVTAPWFQKLQLEHLLKTPHDVYIATGGGWPGGGRPSIGPGLDPSEGQRGLERLTGRTGFSQLDSVRNRRVHGVWSGIIATPPLFILFVECAAKWLHPERCADISPDETLDEINRLFLTTPIEGPLWVSIEE